MCPEPETVLELDALSVAEHVYATGAKVRAPRCGRCWSPAFPDGCILPAGHEEREHVVGASAGEIRERWLVWAELGDLLRLVLVAQAQAYIDAVFPAALETLESLERARALAVQLEQKVEWLTPSYQRDAENVGDRLALRGYVIGDGPGNE